MLSETEMEDGMTRQLIKLGMFTILALFMQCCYSLAAEKVVVVPLSVNKTSSTQWALVDYDGTILNQSGGISVLSTSSGSYWLDFGQDLTGHAIMATPQGGQVNTGYAYVAICGGVGVTGSETHFCGGGAYASTNVLSVVTKSSNGIIAPYPFYVVVLP